MTATYSRAAGETVAGGPYTISATLSPAACWRNYTITYNTGELHHHHGGRLGDADARRARPTATADPALTGTLSGFLAADSVTATYSRTAGETVAGGPYTISATLGPAAVLSNYTITYNTAELHHHAAAGLGDADAASKTYGDADPALTGTLTRLPGGRRRDGDLQPRRRARPCGRPLHDQRDAEPGGGARQLHHHLQHGRASRSTRRRRR